MYGDYLNKREILLWSFATVDGNSDSDAQKSRKRSRSQSTDEDSQSAPSKREKCQQKLKDVEQIVVKLKEKHKSSFFC